MKRIVDSASSYAATFLIVATTIILAFPVLVSALMAFDSREFLGAFPPTGLSIQWFESFYTNVYLQRALRTSVALAATTTILSVAIGSLAALALHTLMPGLRDLLATVFLSPLMLPGVIIGFALLLLFSVFDVVPPFLRILVGHLIITIPYTIRMTLVGLAGVKQTWVEAALSLGSNKWQTFFAITLPLSKNGIAAGAIFAFAFSMDDVAISLFLSDADTFTLPVALIGYMRARFDLTVAAAAFTLMCVTLLLLFALDRVLGLEKLIGEGVHKG